MVAAVDIAREWLLAFESCVRRLDFAGAREMFDPRTLGFGSEADDNLVGLDMLERRQWRQVWPMIERFTFDMEGLQVFGDAGGNDIGLAVRWTSTGVAENGDRFPRPGRATLVLRKTGRTWLCCHSHFSLVPGVHRARR